MHNNINSTIERYSQAAMREQLFSPDMIQKTKAPSFGGGSNLYKAFCKTNAGAATTIVCYKDTDTTGDEITVNCSVIGSANLNAAAPRLADGSLIFVAKIGTDWWCTSPFIKSKACPK